MSTKIYNGYYSNLSIEKLLERFKRLSPKIKQMKQDYLTHELVCNYVLKIDKRVIVNREKISDIKQSHEFIDYLLTVNSEVRNIVRKGERTYLDLSASCTVFPLKDRTLILFYSESKYQTALFRSLRFIKDYHYQNQSDKPDKIPDKVWDQRRIDWNKALGGDGWGVPCECGYGFTFCDESVPFSEIIETLKTEQKLPDKKERANAVLCEVFMEKEIEKIKEKEKRDIIAYVRAKEKWHEFKKTDEYQKEIKDIIPKLPKIEIFSEMKNK